jgi:hypothetical protein
MSAAVDDDQRELAYRGRWLLQSAIAGVACQPKSRALVAVVPSPEIRQSRDCDADARLCNRPICAPSGAPWFRRDPSTIIAASHGNLRAAHGRTCWLCYPRRTGRATSGHRAPVPTQKQGRSCGRSAWCEAVVSAGHRRHRGVCKRDRRTRGRAQSRERTQPDSWDLAREATEHGQRPGLDAESCDRYNAW